MDLEPTAVGDAQFDGSLAKVIGQTVIDSDVVVEAFEDKAKVIACQASVLIIKNVDVGKFGSLFVVVCRCLFNDSCMKAWWQYEQEVPSHCFEE